MSAPRSRPPAPRRCPPKTSAEQILEDVGHRAAGRKAALLPAAAILEGGMAEAIVSRALLPVREHLIGFVEFLEAPFGILVAGVAVGVAIHGGLAEGGLHLRIGGGFSDAEHFIEIALGHYEDLAA